MRLRSLIILLALAVGITFADPVFEKTSAQSPSTMDVTFRASWINKKAFDAFIADKSNLNKVSADSFRAFINYVLDEKAPVDDHSNRLALFKSTLQRRELWKQLSAPDWAKVLRYLVVSPTHADFLVQVPIFPQFLDEFQVPIFPQFLDELHQVPGVVPKQVINYLVRPDRIDKIKSDLRHLYSGKHVTKPVLYHVLFKSEDDANLFKGILSSSKGFEFSGPVLLDTLMDVAKSSSFDDKHRLAQIFKLDDLFLWSPNAVNGNEIFLYQQFKDLLQAWEPLSSYAKVDLAYFLRRNWIKIASGNMDARQFLRTAYRKLWSSQVATNIILNSPGLSEFIDLSQMFQDLCSSVISATETATKSRAIKDLTDFMSNLNAMERVLRAAKVAKLEDPKLRDILLHDEHFIADMFMSGSFYPDSLRPLSSTEFKDSLGQGLKKAMQTQEDRRKRLTSLLTYVLQKLVEDPNNFYLLLKLGEIRDLMKLHGIPGSRVSAIAVSVHQWEYQGLTPHIPFSSAPQIGASGHSLGQNVPAAGSPPRLPETLARVLQELHL